MVGVSEFSLHFVHKSLNENAHCLDDANVHNVDAQNVCETIAEKKFWKLDTVQQNKTRKVCTQTVGKSLRDRFFCEFLHSNVNNAIATL